MKIHKVLGLMSGTSLDGLDLAYCNFWKEDGRWNFEIKEASTLPYDESLRTELTNAIHLKEDDLNALDKRFGRFLGELVARFLEVNQLTADYVASHGHTVHHRPDLGFTRQIGDGQQLANESRCITICDFRSKDIYLGGQGAPLVPIGDQAFFSKHTFCLNLGGICNVSWHKDGRRIAYDIGIANMLLNHLSQKMGQTYDDGGSIARSGSLDKKLYNQLNSLEYYHQPFPKSTGYEWFQADILPIVAQSDLSTEDLLHTSVHHIAEQIARQLLSHSQTDHNTVLITGGGAYNKYLMEVLGDKLGTQVKIVIPESDLVSYKEAMVFAFMGLLRMEGEVNVLSSVTGAKNDSSSGKVYYPD